MYGGGESRCRGGPTMRMAGEASVPSGGAGEARSRDELLSAIRAGSRINHQSSCNLRNRIYAVEYVLAFPPSLFVRFRLFLSGAVANSFRRLTLPSHVAGWCGAFAMDRLRSLEPAICSVLSVEVRQRRLIRTADSFFVVSRAMSTQRPRKPVAGGSGGLTVAELCARVKRRSDADAAADFTRTVVADAAKARASDEQDGDPHHYQTREQQQQQRRVDTAAKSRVKSNAQFFIDSNLLAAGGPHNHRPTTPADAAAPSRESHVADAGGAVVTAAHHPVLSAAHASSSATAAATVSAASTCAAGALRMRNLWRESLRGGRYWRQPPWELPSSSATAASHMESSPFQHHQRHHAHHHHHHHDLSSPLAPMTSSSVAQDADVQPDVESPLVLPWFEHGCIVAVLRLTDDDLAAEAFDDPDAESRRSLLPLPLRRERWHD